LAVTVKICGLRREADVLLCGELGVGIAGFVVEYPLPVPWSLTESEAAGLLPLVAPPMKSCVVTGGDREKTLALALSLRPDFVQLHFNETLDDTRRIAWELASRGIGVIKTLPLPESARLAQFGTADVSACAALISGSGAAAILVDSRAPENAGDASSPPDFAVFREAKRASGIPVILAGGITPANVGNVLLSARPAMIDVMTGVESSPGVKDGAALRELLEKARGSCA